MREAIALLAGAFDTRVPDGEVEALWAAFSAADVPAFYQRRDLANRDGAEETHGNIMRKTVHAVVRHNVQRIEERLGRMEKETAARLERMEVLLERLASSTRV